jgi:hypothetical protein
MERGFSLIAQKRSAIAGRLEEAGAALHPVNPSKAAGTLIVIIAGPLMSAAEIPPCLHKIEKNSFEVGKKAGHHNR